MDPGPHTIRLLPGLPFALAAEQSGKCIGKSHEPADLQHERHPRLRNHELGKWQTSLRLPDAPLNQLSASLRWARFYKLPYRDREPLTLCPFLYGLACRLPHKPPMTVR